MSAAPGPCDEVELFERIVDRRARCAPVRIGSGESEARASREGRFVFGGDAAGEVRLREYLREPSC